MKSNLNYKNPKKNIKPKRPLTSKNVHKKSPNILASEESKRIYQTQGTYPNSKFLKQLNTDKLEIYLNILNPADVAVISKILPKYTYFQQLILGAFEPKPLQTPIQRTNYYSQKNRSSKSLGKPVKKGKNNNIKESDRVIFKQKLFTATEKNLINSKNLLSLSLLSFKIDQNLSKILSKGIQENKSLQYLSINNSVISVESFEVLLKGVLTHEILRFLDLSNNKLSDNYCPMISRIIQRQAQRRDQIVWSYQLRNELPSDNNYKIGLISLNLHGNYLGPKSAKLISASLNNDQYIRYIDLSKNNFDNASCKLFVHMMRKNNTLLTVDLRDNLGYDEFINPRIVMKMSKNIKYLYSQYQNGEYTEEEFEYLKGFIDISFFDVDIPQEIVQYYNNNIQQTADNRNNNNNPKQNNFINNNDKKNKDINNKNTNDYDAKDNNDMNINEIENKEQNDLYNKKIKNEINNKINNNNSNSNKNINEKQSNTEYQKNQKLIKENLKLKQEIQELKSKNIENENISQKEIEKPDEEEKDLENYYNRANQIIDTLNEVMAKLQQHKDKNDNNFNINEINELIANKKNEIIEKEKKLSEQDKNKKQQLDNKNKNKADNNNEDGKKDKNIKKDEINNNDKKDKIIIEKKPDDKNIKKDEDNNKNKRINVNDNVNNDNISFNKNKKEEKPLLKEDKNEMNNMKEKEEIMKKEVNDIKEEKNELKKNNNMNNKNELINSDEEEDEGDFNLDNLTEEEKLALLQQNEILMKLQEEAEARGEHFDIQEYLAQLAEHSEEDDEFEQQENKSNKLNKSF